MTADHLAPGLIDIRRLQHDDLKFLVKHLSLFRDKIGPEIMANNFIVDAKKGRGVDGLAVPWTKDDAKDAMKWDDRNYRGMLRWFMPMGKGTVRS